MMIGNPLLFTWKKGLTFLLKFEAKKLNLVGVRLFNAQKN
jgi:hypothetical protein